MEEIWKDIQGYKGYYQVSNFGRVKSVAHKQPNSIGRVRNYPERIITLHKDNRKNKGYLSACLSVNGEKVLKQVHRLVAIAFIANPNNLPQVNHKDEDVANNRVDNLEWCSAEYNLNYGQRNKRASDSRGRNVIQLSINGDIINEHTGTRNAARNIGVNPDGGANIAACCKGKKKTAYGYKWQWAV